MTSICTITLEHLYCLLSCASLLSMLRRSMTGEEDLRQFSRELPDVPGSSGLHSPAQDSCSAQEAAPTWMTELLEKSFYVDIKQAMDDFLLPRAKSIQDSVKVVLMLKSLTPCPFSDPFRSQQQPAADGLLQPEVPACCLALQI